MSFLFCPCSQRFHSFPTRRSSDLPLPPLLTLQRFQRFGRPPSKWRDELVSSHLSAPSNLLSAFSVSAFQRIRRALASSLFALRSMFQLFSISEVFGVCFSSSLSVERWTLSVGR